MSILREFVPNAGRVKKIELARTLFKNDSERLTNLALYYTMKREKSFYLLRKKTTVSGQIKPKELLSLRGKSNKERISADSVDDFIAICDEVTDDSKKAEVYLKLKIHSAKKRYRGEEPDTLQPKSIELRKGFKVFVTFHEDKKVLECRTFSPLKTDYARMALGKFLFDNVDSLEVIKLSIDEQRSIDPAARYKKALISDMKFSGADEIVIKGEDVQNTIDVLKERHNLDLVNLGILSLQKSELKDATLKFSNDGKIKAKKSSTEDPYELIKRFL